MSEDTFGKEEIDIWGRNSKSAFDELEGKAQEFDVAWNQNWSDVIIETDEVAESLNSFISQTRELFKEVEAYRKQVKEPHRAAAEKVDDTFRVVKDAIEAIAKKAKAKMTDWAVVVQQREKEKIEAERAAARAREEEARRQLAAAEKERSDIAKAKAEKELKTAQKKAKTAERRTASGTVKSSSGGRAMSLRTVYSGKIEEPVLALATLKGEPEILEALQRCVDRKIREAGGDIEIPGVEIVSKKVAV